MSRRESAALRGVRGRARHVLVAVVAAVVVVTSLLLGALPVRSERIDRSEPAAPDLLGFASATEGATGPTYYVDAVDGRDENDGGSAERPWQSLARVNAEVLPPGSVVLLRGSQVFPGSLLLDGGGDEEGGGDGGDGGGANGSQPTVGIGSFGSGKATISSGGAPGIVARNRVVALRDLQVVGDFAGGTDGIAISNDLAGDVLLDGVVVSGVEVSGYGGWGIILAGGVGRSGYRNALFEDVDVHDNGDGGLLTYAQEPAVHENVRVLRSRSHDNPGYPGASGHTGNGLVLGGVSGGEIAHSSAYRNGGANDRDDEGPAGIWTYHSDRVTIQFNESYDNRTGSGADGDGFDLDIGTTNSVVQYNYSHGNDGAGFLLWQTGPTASGSNLVRYNISEDDGRRNGYGGITAGGSSPGTRVVHNTVFTSTPDVADTVDTTDAPDGPDAAPDAAAAPTPAALAVLDASAGYDFQNNIFVVTPGLPVVAAGPAPPDASVTMRGNAYHAGGGAFEVRWGAVTFDSLETWRAATGQERVDAVDVGLFADPLLLAIGSGGTVGDPASLESLTAYRLAPDSPLIGAALPLEPTVRGGRDFYGRPVPAGGAADIGAHEAA